MNNTPLCPKCQGAMDDGSASATSGSLVYRSNKQAGNKTTPIRAARVCLKCGYVEFYLIPQELREKLQK